MFENLEQLVQIIREKKNSSPDKSYTNKLLNDKNLNVAKVKEDKIIKMNEQQNKLFGIEKLNIKRSTIPAVTHLDYSARIQTVNKETNKKYYELIKKFKKKTVYVGLEIKFFL